MGGVIGLESDSFATHKTMCIFEKVPNFFIPSGTDKNLFQQVSANYYSVTIMKVYNNSSRLKFQTLVILKIHIKSMNRYLLIVSKRLTYQSVVPYTQRLEKYFMQSI